jgi:predicted nucleic acid-binding protein
LDNTVLTNFALGGQPQLVLRLWGDAACTTSVVLNEYQAGVGAGLVPAAWHELPIVTLTESETSFAAELPPRLGAGERSCLAVAKYREGLLATDDRDARQTARQHGISVTGTIGILVLAVHQSHLSQDEANELLKDMIDAGYRSPVTDLNALG